MALTLLLLKTGFCGRFSYLPHLPYRRGTIERF
jgi:hypothetical protein